MLLKLLVQVMNSSGFKTGAPETYIGYQECCDRLGLQNPQNEHWGRFLQRHGLNDLNGWTKVHGFPKITGIIVNQRGDRAFRPGPDYFKSNGQKDGEWQWWENEVAQAAKFDWSPYV
ncbi:MAG TPA: hypothetical protein VEH27_13685 [Methylomirabilota bacterium]|nr:hypothetical protein [Methylomirabilota bacterium]